MTKNNIAKLKYFASLPAGERLAMKIRLDPIIRDDLNKRSVILYKGGYFDAYPFDGSRPKSMTDESINVVMTDEFIDQLTFEKEYAKIVEHVKDHLSTLAHNHPDMMKYLSQECYDVDTFCECMKTSEMIYQQIGYYADQQDLLKFFVLADSYKIASYLALSDLVEAVYYNDSLPIRLVEILMSCLKDIITKGFVCSYKNTKCITDVIWGISNSNSNLSFNRYISILDKITDGSALSDRLKTISSINDIGEYDGNISTDYKPNADTSNASSRKFMINNGYSEDDYTCFDNIVPRITYNHGDSSLSIPFNIISTLYETDTITDILRVPHNRIKRTAVLCKFNDVPYILFIDKDNATDGNRIIVKGLELAHPDNDYKVLSLKVSSDSKYDYVFDKFD